MQGHASLSMDLQLFSECVGASCNHSWSLTTLLSVPYKKEVRGWKLRFQCLHSILMTLLWV